MIRESVHQAAFPIALRAGLDQPAASGPRREVEHDAVAQLVRLSVAGDAEAFRLLVERYQAMVFCIIRRIVPDCDEAEDIAQQVFVNAYFALPRFDFRGSLYSWIYRIALNECFDWVRRRKVWRKHFAAEVPERETAAPEFNVNSPAQRFDRRLEQREILVKLLTQISREDRLLLVMKECEGYHTNELARMLGINENTIKVRLLRARRKLSQAAEQMGFAPVAPERPARA